MDTMGPMRAALSSSSKVSTAFFSADCGRLKNGTQMQVSMRTRRIRLGRFECVPIVVHHHLAGEFFQPHPAGITAIFVEGGPHRAHDIIHACEIAEVPEFIVSEIDGGSHDGRVGIATGECQPANRDPQPSLQTESVGKNIPS